MFGNVLNACCVPKKLLRGITMKKFYCIFAVLIAAVILLPSCGTTGTGGGRASSTASSSSSRAAVPVQRTAPGGVPDFVRNAIINAPEDVLVGIGTARMATQGQSLTIATTRARAEISRQMDTLVRDMIRDYSATSEVDPSSQVSFTEIMTVSLSQSRLQGASVKDFNYTDDGTCWVVVYYGKSSVIEEINQSQAAAKLRVPAMASFDAEARMNEAFAAINSQEAQVRRND